MKQWGMLAAVVLLAGCGGGPQGTGSEPRGSLVRINGAGATFPYPIYAKWFDEFYRMHPNVQINYQSIGSGGGIRQLLAGTVDFGGSDSPMTDEQLAQANNAILHFPTVVGAVVPTYNLAGAGPELNFTPEALVGIFMGKIRKWNHPELRKANRTADLPASDIVVVHRSDGSGTTFVWTDYLSKVSPAWKKSTGSGTSVNWPRGLGAKGNEGVAGLVKQTPDSIGYVELVYALQNKMAYGRVGNAAGEFVKADLPSVTAAAAASPMPPDFRVSITNPPGKEAYPVASFTWLLIPARIGDAAKREALKEFLKWMLADGQKLAPGLGYAPLPSDVVQQEIEALARIE